MKNRRILISWCCVMLILSVRAYGQVAVDLSDELRSIPSNFIGLNGRSTEGPEWSDPDFISLVDKLSPGTVRYPAGTQANYWDWRTGTFIEGCGKTAKYLVPMYDFISGLPTNTSIIYVANMARPTPHTGIPLESPEEVLKSEATLLLKIDDMKAALQEFERLGSFPEAIELGNEFYFTNEHAAIYAGDPELYMNHCKIICESIKADYPDLKIILVTTKGGTAGRDNWNNKVFEVLSGDETFSKQVYAVVQHHYINDAYGSDNIVTDESTAIEAIAEGIQYPREHLLDYDLIPDGLKLWITEFGATKSNAIDTWASGLRSVAMTIGFMDQGNKIDRLLYHHITDDPEVIHKEEMKVGAIGMCYGLLSKAAIGKRQLQKIHFINNPTISGDVKALHAYKFKGIDEETIFIANLGNVMYQDVDIKSLISEESEGIQTQYWSNDPYQTPVYNGMGMNQEEISVNSGITIYPFSVSAIVYPVEHTNTASINKDNTVNVYPVVFTNSFTVKIEERIRRTQVCVYNMAGELIYNTEVDEPQTGHTPNLVPGIYMVVISLGDKQYCQKVIKQ